MSKSLRGLNDIEEHFMTLVLASVFFINLGIFAVETATALFIIIRYRDYLNRKSPIALFACTLALEAFDNFCDCVMCFYIQIFHDFWNDYVFAAFKDWRFWLIFWETSSET